MYRQVDRFHVLIHFYLSAKRQFYTFVNTFPEIIRIRYVNFVSVENFPGGSYHKRLIMTKASEKTMVIHALQRSSIVEIQGIYGVDTLLVYATNFLYAIVRRTDFIANFKVAKFPPASRCGYRRVLWVSFTTSTVSSRNENVNVRMEVCFLCAFLGNKEIGLLLSVSFLSQFLYVFSRQDLLSFLCKQT